MPSHKLPPAFVCDIDGTVAEMSTRGPFDWRLVKYDLPREPVVAVVRALMQAYPVIFVSGRSNECRDDTAEWLAKHVLPPGGFAPLHMRKARDFRPDEVVKAEIAREISRDFEIIGAFDDRPKVIRMWRELGIQVFDVGDGREF